jgi:hypothetical protein
MTGDSDPAPKTEPTFIERPVRRIANARSVTLGLAVMFLVLAVFGAIVMRIVDQDNFPTLGSAVWWALQTITTVGYGDVVPTTAAGQVVGGSGHFYFSAVHWSLVGERCPRLLS